jgi:hypothetical protein
LERKKLPLCYKKKWGRFGKVIFILKKWLPDEQGKFASK